MIYAHTKRIQALLHVALRIRGGSIGTIIKEAKLSCSQSSLDRFRTALEIEKFLEKDEAGTAFDAIDNLGGQFLSYVHAKQLWDYLNKRGDIERAIKQKNIDKNLLYHDRDFANIMQCFYNIQESDQFEFDHRGLHGKFVCFKKSFRRPGFILKSIVRISQTNDEYFDFAEEQHLKVDFMSHKEFTDGFGFIKSDCFWVFGRERGFSQPRIFCFHKSFSETAEGDRSTKIIGWYGYVIEITQLDKRQFRNDPVVLLSQEVDKRLWHDEKGVDTVYNPVDHLNAFPYEPDTLNMYPNKITHAIPKAIIEYIERGVEVY